MFGRLGIGYFCVSLQMEAFQGCQKALKSSVKMIHADSSLETPQEMALKSLQNLPPEKRAHTGPRGGETSARSIGLFKDHTGRR